MQWGFGAEAPMGPGLKPLGQRDFVPMKLMTFCYFRD